MLKNVNNLYFYSLSFGRFKNNAYLCIDLIKEILLLTTKQKNYEKGKH